MQTQKYTCSAHQSFVLSNFSGQAFVCLKAHKILIHKHCVGTCLQQIYLIIWYSGGINLHQLYITCTCTGNWIQKGIYNQTVTGYWNVILLHKHDLIKLLILKVVTENKCVSALHITMHLTAWVIKWLLKVFKSH